MSDSPAEKIHAAIAKPILSERTLRYKRNMFLAAAFAAVHTYGKLDSNEFTLSGAEYALPHADTTIGVVLLTILLYLAVGYYRYAASDLVMWKTQFHADEQNLLSAVLISGHKGTSLSQEHRTKLRFNAVFEFYGPLALSALAWAALTINMTTNVMGKLAGA